MVVVTIGISMINEECELLLVAGKAIRGADGLSSDNYRRTHDHDESFVTS